MQHIVFYELFQHLYISIKMEACGWSIAIDELKGDIQCSFKFYLRTGSKNLMVVISQTCFYKFC